MKTCYRCGAPVEELYHILFSIISGEWYIERRQDGTHCAACAAYQQRTNAQRDLDALDAVRMKS